MQRRIGEADENFQASGDSGTTVGRSDRVQAMSMFDPARSYSVLLGAFLVDRDRRIVALEGRLENVLGVEAPSLYGQALSDLVHHDSHPAVEHLLCESGVDDTSADLVLLSHTGLQLHVKAHVARIESRGRRFFHFVIARGSSDDWDGDENVDLKARFHALAESSRDVIAVVGIDGMFKYANPALERVLGIDREVQDLIKVLDLVHPEDQVSAKDLFTRYGSVAGSHPPTTHRLRTASGGWRTLEVIATNHLHDPSVRGIVVNARDVTERNSLTRALLTLSRGNQVMIHARDEQSLLDEMCKAIVEYGGYRLAWVGFAEDDQNKTVRPMASFGRTKYLEGIFVSWDDNEFGRGTVGTAIRTARAQVREDMLDSEELAPWFERAKGMDLNSICTLPLSLDGKVIGTLSIYSDERGVFDSEAVELLQELANDLAFGIARIRDSISLAERENRYRTFASVAPIGIIEVSSGVVRFANARAAEICGKDMDEIVGKALFGENCVGENSGLESLSAKMAGGDQTLAESFRIERPDGEHRHVRLAAARLSENPESYLATIEDVTNEVKAQEALQHQAFHDSLTNLPNRALFLDRLGQELAASRRNGKKIAILFIDLDRLKIVNDGLGHEAGDAVLNEVARRLSSEIRTGETAARFSGDEFVVIVREISDYQNAVSVAERILRSLSDPIEYMGNELIMGASIGIVIPEENADPRTVVRDADTAMYKAKLSGGNRYALFDQDLHQRLLERLHMESQLRRAIENREFELHFQPKVDPSTDEPVGAEALIRWNHPEKGVVFPLDFIGVAEESGLIKVLGNWVIEEAMAQLAAWDADGGPRVQILSVNLSTLQLEDLSIVELVRDALEKNNIEPGRFAIEVTESVLMLNSPSTKRCLIELRQLGVLIGIDDFGTGYSSLAYLHTLPVAVLKVDKSFIERLGGEDDSTPIVRAIIEMSHALGLGVVAEGVGDARVRDRIATMGFELAQGYYWAEPMSPDEFATWWKHQERMTRAL